MKLFFDGIIVVEGKNDASYLSSFVDTVFVITNGYEIPQKEIEFLKETGYIPEDADISDYEEE